MIVSALPREPDALRRLPLVTLYLTERCNSRCRTCDYWRHGRADMDLAAVSRLLPSLRRLGTRTVMLSGGEPLLNRQWEEIASLLTGEGHELWLLTSGLSLAKHARRAAMLFRTITVSLDGTDAATYASIRGIDAFDVVCAGIRAAADTGVRVTVRVTLQRANFWQLASFVDLAQRLGAHEISFLAVDVANPHAFARHEDFDSDLALHPEELAGLERLILGLERDRGEAFASGFIAESPAKLRRIHQYFSAVCGLGAYPTVRCNAPEFSAVIDAQGRVSPCFFIAGPSDARVRNGLDEVLNRSDMAALRASIRVGGRRECKTCVCSMWRECA
ncbi:MAG TPA: radical SAM protein [Steroidobacteraceae bacterium]|nr:radical SAM protein [Steroidobacteraceae bacterium]